MAKAKQIGMAAGTFSVALGIGFVMQNGDALASRFGSDTTVQQPAPFTQTATRAAFEQEPEPFVLEEQPAPVAVVTAQASVFPEAPAIAAPDLAVEAAVILPDAAVVPTKPTAPVQLATLDPEVVPDLPAEVAVVPENCVPTLSAQSGPAAMVALSVEAPCYAETQFVVHHQGMMFTAMTDADGNANVDVPALAEVAVMIAAFADGDGAVATAIVPDFAMYDRAVLQWQGDTSVMLSAYENDASFGDDDHIHVDNPGDVARLSASEGGYLIRLGDPTLPDALMAEVYTFPTAMMGAGPNVMLVAEAEITDTNCGQDLSAQSIQVSPTGTTSALDLTLTMPACDAVGDFLILQNMFEDLTLASK